jgi:hypothetical protein
MKNIKKTIALAIPSLLLKQAIKKRLQNREVYQWIKNGGQDAPPPHKIKQWAIARYQRDASIHVLVETGACLGDMVAAQLNNFRKIYSIELSGKLARHASRRFKKQPKVEIIQGDSGKILKTLVPKINEQAIFWLDGHYSGGITAKGDTNCPVYEELSAIFQAPFNHIILIDDARCFTGDDDYPSLRDLSAYILHRKPAACIEVRDDIIRIT